MNTDRTYSEANSTCPEHQQTQPPEIALHYKIQCRPWEVVVADIFMVNDKTFLCVQVPNFKEGGQSQQMMSWYK